MQAEIACSGVRSRFWTGMVGLGIPVRSDEKMRRGKRDAMC